MSQSAFIVPVPEAEERVHSLRRRFDPTARLGVPAHITVLYPFMAPELIDELAVSEIQALLGNASSFAFSLDRVERFPDATYLAPNPAANFASLTSALVARFPNYPPYGGRFETIVPHLTVAQGSQSATVEAQRELSEAINSKGPIYSVCRSVVLIENSSGIWRHMHTFLLADKSAQATCEDARG